MDYFKTIIYKICCKDTTINDIYIGHTINFIKRRTQHKLNCYNENNKAYNRKNYQFIRNNGGWDNWSMIQIEEYNCNNKREAEMRERYWIETLNATLNCNNPYGMYTEKIEYQKKYAQDNKEQISE